MMAFKLK